MRHLVIYLPKTMPRLNGGLKKFNLASTLTGVVRTFAGSASAPKALTLQRRASIRPPMAAGAILPPMFFERHRLCEHIRSENGIFRNTLKTTPASPAQCNGRRH